MNVEMEKSIDVQNMFMEVYENERKAIDNAIYKAKKDMESLNEDGREHRMIQFREELYEISRTHSKLISEIAEDHGMHLNVDAVREMCKVKFEL